MRHQASQLFGARCPWQAAGCYLRDWGRIWPWRALFHPKRSAQVEAVSGVSSSRAGRLGLFSSSRSWQQPKGTLARVPVQPRALLQH